MKDIDMTPQDGIFTAVDLKDAAILGALGNTRTYYQYRSMYNSFREGKCPFCHLDELKFPPVITKGNWVVKPNDMPYNNCEHHLVIVYAAGHITDWKTLSREDYADYMEIINMAEEMFHIEGCGIVSRRGAIRRHAGTLTHIHSHIMVVQLDEEGLPVGELRAYFAKNREELAQCRKMVELFEKVRQGEATGFTRVHKGLIVFRGGSYLSYQMDHWQKHDRPDWAEIITSPLDEIKARIQGATGVKVYEAMQTAETGPVLMDGPFSFEEYLVKKNEE